MLHTQCPPCVQLPASVRESGTISFTGPDGARDLIIYAYRELNPSVCFLPKTKVRLLQWPCIATWTLGVPRQRLQLTGVCPGDARQCVAGHTASW